MAGCLRIFFIVALSDGKETQDVHAVANPAEFPPDTPAGWGTLSLVNAGLAQAKQRSGLLWWVFSLVLGPVATFLVVVLPRVEREGVVVTPPRV